MSVQKVTKEMFHCTCDRKECTYSWDAEHVPQRCPKCKSRRWNRPARIVGKNFLTFNGETLSVAAWSRKLGLAKTTIPWRIKEGWPMDQVLSNDDWRYKESGFTVFELLYGLIILASITIVGLAFYAGFHFIMKYW